ncbi:hypothetical protein TSUD_28940 [Trifolium subterraneum]|uniref:Uncharacterized protein n=1 Tax=Trifolium subterraneum TaxID=3900 RepID=A0A2Z6PHA3_TRISU|nr:hypothetical protein TSUD_28940 [Trifolium subterraneum]
MQRNDRVFNNKALVIEDLVDQFKFHYCNWFIGRTAKSPYMSGGGVLMIVFIDELLFGFYGALAALLCFGVVLVCLMSCSFEFAVV